MLNYTEQILTTALSNSLLSFVVKLQRKTCKYSIRVIKVNKRILYMKEFEGWTQYIVQTYTI